MKESVLIIVAHSDDECISMAGTIHKHIKNGDKVVVVSMTDGVGSRDDTNQSKKFERKNSSLVASKILGFEWGDCYDFKDNAMDSYPLLDIIKAIEEVKKKYEPTLVYTHSGTDLNVDHVVVSNAVLTAFRPEPNEYCKEIRLFEVASATDYGNLLKKRLFAPNLFIDITNEWTEKSNSLEAYASEMKDYPHTRSIEGIKNLSKIRGNQVGLEFAEAFEVIRKIEK